MKESKSCMFPDCEEKFAAKGYCMFHYRQYQHGRKLTPRKTSLRWVNEDGTPMKCGHKDGCTKDVQSMGLCAQHYSNWIYMNGKGKNKSKRNSKRTDSLGNAIPCKFPGCQNAINARGFCVGHILQQKRGEEMRPLKSKSPCLVNECKNTTIWGNVLCQKHSGLTYKYSLTKEESIQAFNNYVCSNKFCNATENLHWDHDHACCPEAKTCGKCNRGWLCQGCNHALGGTQDKPEKLRGLADYLESYNA